MIAKYSASFIRRRHLLPKALFMNSSSKGNEKDGVEPQNGNKPQDQHNTQKDKELKSNGNDASAKQHLQQKETLKTLSEAKNLSTNDVFMYMVKTNQEQKQERRKLEQQRLKREQQQKQERRKLEQQRLKREQQQKQERRKLEQQRLKREQQLEQQRLKREQKQQTQKNIFRIGTLVCSLIGAYCYLKVNSRQEKLTDQFNEQKLLKIYGEDPIKIREYEKQKPVNGSAQLPKNTTRKQIERITQQSPQFVKFATGMPGYGKSTQIKKLVMELREKGEKAYYFNLRQDSLDRQIKTQKQGRTQIQKLRTLLTAIAQKNEGSQQKRVYIFIDDINFLEALQAKPENQMLVFDLLLKLTNIKSSFANLVVISSSSSYVQKLMQRSYIEKQSMSYNIDNKTNQEIKYATAKIFDFYCKKNKLKPEQFEKVANYIVNSGCNLRQAVKYAIKITTSTKSDELLAFIKDRQNDQIEIKSFQIKQFMKQKKTHKFDQLIYRTTIEEICSVKEYKHHKTAKQVKYNVIQRCLKQKEEYEDLAKDQIDRDSQIKIYISVKYKTLIQELNRMNITFYNYPRNGLARRILQQVLL